MSIPDEEPTAATFSDHSDDDDEETQDSAGITDIEVTMDYDIEFPPPKPGPEWTRFVCISDTHGSRFQVPRGDVLLHAGDLTRKGKVSELRSTLDWLAGLPHPYKLVIAGNHDRSLDPNAPKKGKHPPDLVYAAAVGVMTSPQARASNIHYLNCESFHIPSVDGRKGWNIYGSPWTPWFRGMAFNYKEDMAQELMNQIPRDTDIVMTHGPPQGILDLTRRENVRAGCPYLFRQIAALQPRLHVFGHIHESRGSRVERWDSSKEVSQSDLHSSSSTVFVNAANAPLASSFGPEATRPDGQRLPIGASGWHPVIVDML